MAEELIKLANKLIWGRIVEIIFVLILISLSIPVWQKFEGKMSAAKITTLEDYNMHFDINQKKNSTHIIAENLYYIHKNYKIYLEVDKNINTKNSKIMLNEEKYSLSEFYYEEKNNKKRYTIIDHDLIGGIEAYHIELKIVGKNKEYRYLYEENNIF